MKYHKMNYTVSEATRFINLGNHSYDVLCSDGKITIPKGEHTIRVCVGCTGSVAMIENIMKPLSKAEFNSMFPPIKGTKYIVSHYAALRLAGCYGRTDVIFVKKFRGKPVWLYSF